VFALATVVSSLVRLVVILLVITAAGVAIAFVASMAHSYSTPSVFIPLQDRFSLPLLFFICVGVIALQYSSRRLWLSRSLLIALPILIGLVAASPFEGRLLNQYYPALAKSAPQPLTLALLPEAQRGPALGTLIVDDAHLTLYVPLASSGVPKGSGFSIDNIRLTLIAPGGDRSISPWQNTFNHRFLPQVISDTVTLDIDRTFVTRHAGEPLRATFDFAMTEIARTSLRSVTLPAHNNADFSVPGVGICQFQPGTMQTFDAFNCRVPFHQPTLTRVEVTRFASACKGARTDPSGARPASSWNGSLNPDLADVGLTPIWTDDISLSNDQIEGLSRGESELRLCPGSELMVSHYGLVRRFLYSFTAPNVQITGKPPDASNPSNDVPPALTIKS
jgi:hypothetical protein